MQGSNAQEINSLFITAASDCFIMYMPLTMHERLGNDWPELNPIKHQPTVNHFPRWTEHQCYG